jgi:glycosyltransferase involved in cell wall biosynthesis
MNIVHLTASTFHGGPERQMLGLARHLPEEYRTVFLSFSEGGKCRSFLHAARRQGFEASALNNDTPRFRSAIREISERLQQLQADVLLCHGYKSDLLGRPAARAAGIPAVAVSRGWTGESWRVRLYERLDRWHLRWMDRVVCVSEAQAGKVRRCGIRSEKIAVIPNSIDPERFADPDPRYQVKLNRYFHLPRGRIIGAAGRLSPEKGFAQLIAAAERVLGDDPTIGFILFGEGPCRAQLQQQINDAGMNGLFVLAGFRADLDKFIPHFDLFVQSSYTEGMPNVILEACAASIPVVATAVGGTPEILTDGISGWLCPPGDHSALAGRILDALTSEETLREIGFQGRQQILERFSFSAQAERYIDLFADLALSPRKSSVENAKPSLPAAVEEPVEESVAGLPSVIHTHTPAPSEVHQPAASLVPTEPPCQ